ncbi:transcription factor EMB1444-like [Rhodamnia argentea]|uniref:Transcription factor EMB1444-like n=1 Tax=Rhodamnia argentea TaxID=178133 RepID=A0A8B8Q793_9MYRT|nr:transcription factor EMB1444-like [Rhodamnia argentea]
MGKITLSEFLKSLCHNSCWIYAIFWKIQHENQMFLSWEDWYCDYLKVRALTGNSPHELSADGNQFLSFDNDGGIIDRTASQIAFAVARTSCLKYKPGEGIIGEVVCTESHCWVSLDDVLVIHCKSETPFNIPDEWLPQISAGVKTILVLPLLPHGVLQLGSHEKVPEIKEAVDHIKSMFSSTGYEQVRYAPLTPNKNPTPSLSSLMPFLLDNMDGSSLIDSIYASGTQFEGLENGAKANRDRLTTCQVIDQLENLQQADDSETLVLPKGLPEISSLPCQPVDANHTEIVDHNDLWFSGMVEDLLVFSKSHNLGISREFSHGLSDSCAANDTSEWSLKSTDADHADHEPTSNMFNFPTDCELHKALGPSFQGQALETSVLFENAFSDSQMSHEVDYFYDVERSVEYLSKDDAEFLLEAIIPNRYVRSQSPSPSESNITKLTVLSRQSDTSSNALNILEGRTSGKNVSAVVTYCKDRVSVPSSPVSMKSTTRSLIKRECWDEVDDPALDRKGEKPLSGYKKRSRKGDNKKPRPRDRQLIQERLRELRILVPSSMKCSIDSLLERTIKHMLFLRRVTLQAEKLTKLETFEQKVSLQDNKNKWEYGPFSGGFHGRTNLAVKSGGEFQACPAPIAVEDLNQPGHMLIKVICNEQGLFLEIAQVITRLELTILKGIFENHSNDTWACFVVEASKDFQKMDIFWPLMQLLRCTRAKVSSKT